MSRAKIVRKNKLWATDRRSTRRYFLFTPDSAGKIAQAFWYCLAYYVQKYEIQLHAALLMSTHPHLFYTDPKGLQPDFKRDFHRKWPDEIELPIVMPALLEQT